jgi:hypothetical protein
MPKWHILASAILAVMVFKVTNSPAAAVACFISGTAIDLDHVLDYYLYSGRLSLNPSEISGFYQDFGKVIVVLHSYELLVVGAVAAYMLEANLLFVGAATGFMGHMLMDTLAYEMKPQSYFLVYRVINGFELRKLCCIDKVHDNMQG